MDAKTNYESTSSQKGVSRKCKKIMNPLQLGILKYAELCKHMQPFELLDVPKRYTRYGSLLLLGSTFTTHSKSWSNAYASLSGNEKIGLFSQVVKAFNDKTLTHVAINAPIAATTDGESDTRENIVRSPTGLYPVFGDFGPNSGECNSQYPEHSDLIAAYWTQTVQLSNIIQVWAPRWTMFSRGNLSEKQRILQGDSSNRPFPGLAESELGHQVDKTDVVDFYVGIGYFAFSYLKRGVARVWGWEINGWSVEGLRRGCIKNGWGVRVIKINDDGNVAEGLDIHELVTEIQRLQHTDEAIRCIVFWGDNKWASTILAKVRLHGGLEEDVLHVRHCNLGLLPSSQNSWYGSVSVLDPELGGWLHVHENVDDPSILTKQQEIMYRLTQIMADCGKASWSATCCHVERVKTYAPGVVHCVYDIKLCPPR